MLVLAAGADDELTFGPAPTAEDLLGHTLPGRAERSGSRKRRRLLRGVLTAAAVIAAVALAVPMARRLPLSEWAAGSLSPTAFGSDEFATETQPATVGLRDGSVVRLAPESRLRVHARDDAREVSLTGRGYFAVAHNDAQPFTVRSEAATVTVLGTRFDLTMSGEDLRLIVIEGRVRLAVRGSQVDVHAGQLAQVRDGNLVPPIDVPDPDSLVGWVGDFVVFQETPLDAVAREIERRHGVRVELARPELGERTITALFAGRSFEEIAEVICAIARLRCEVEGDVLRMTPAI